VIRDFRASDAPAVVGLLTTQFPEEEALLGSRPERFFKVMQRVSRWDMRLLFALLRLARKRVFQFLVYEENGRLVGTTLLTFPPRAVFLSMVVVDPAARRRGYAKALLDRAQANARRMHRPYLALNVLTANTPARALYEGKLGYRPLLEAVFMSRDRPAEVGPERSPLPNGIRLSRKSDDPALVALVCRQTPAEVQEVLPVPRKLLASTRTGDRIMGSESAAWVLDRGAGAEAMIATTSTPDAEAAHMNEPIVSETADPALVRELVRTALAWCGARGRIRVVCSVSRHNGTGRAALEGEGFHDAFSHWTLYRPVE
jgi:ribosomal protein S18 acetylase RimI-like enzyme